MTTHPPSGVEKEHETSSAQFEQLLTREILLGLQLRTSLLAKIFAFGLLVFLVLFALSILEGTPFPFLAPLYAAALMLYEIGVRNYIRRRIGANRVVPHGMWYLNAFLEVSILSVGILLLQIFVYTDPVYSLLSTPVLGFCLFITLSTLLVDFWVSVFTGAVAALEYSGIAIYTLYFVDHESTLDPLFLGFSIYFGKACILLMVGLGAGFVARELRERMLRTFESIQDRDRMATANQLKSRFLANMSHEIRTPLNAILGYGQILDSDDGLSPSQRRAVGAIQSSGSHLLGLINEILDLSKIEAGRQDLYPAAFSLSGMIADMEAAFAIRCAAKDLLFSVTIDIDRRSVFGDERKLRQVLMNLLGNAVKFTTAGEVRLGVTRSGDDITFVVSDTGAGIPRDRQANLFEPFLQDEAGRKHGGTGLGLAIASQLVRLMGGTLEVDSEPGAETRFSFTIPLPESTELSLDQTQGSTRVQHLAPGNTVNALVVDDVTENREVLALMLERIGVAVSQTASGEETLEMLSEALPDIIFTDIRMEGLSGLRTMQEIVARHGRGNLKFVAVSASALSHERQKYLDSGFDAFLDKPVRMERLYACLAEVTGVEYTVTTANRRETADQGGDVSLSIVLPAEVLASLEEAVVAHNMTKLRKSLAELDALGPAEQELATHLRKLSMEYDMDALLNVVNQLPRG